MKNKKLLLGVGIGALVLILTGGLVANNAGLFQGKVRQVAVVQPTRLIFTDATPDNTYPSLIINECPDSWKKIAEWNAWIGVSSNPNDLSSYVQAPSSKTLSFTQITTRSLKDYIDFWPDEFDFESAIPGVEDYKLVIRNETGSTLFEKIVNNNAFVADATFVYSPKASLLFRGGENYRVLLYARNFDEANIDDLGNYKLDSQIVSVKNKSQSLNIRNFGMERTILLKDTLRADWEGYNDDGLPEIDSGELCPTE